MCKFFYFTTTGGRERHNPVNELYLWNRSQIALTEVFRLLTRKNFCSIKVDYCIRTVDWEGVFSHCGNSRAKAKVSKTKQS